MKYNFIITPILSSLQHFLWTTLFSLVLSLIKDLNFLIVDIQKYVYIYKNINILLIAHNGNHLRAHPWERFFSHSFEISAFLICGQFFIYAWNPKFPPFLVTCLLESSLFMSFLVSNTDKTWWESWKYNLTVHFLFSSWQKSRVEKWLFCVKRMFKRWAKQ